MDDKLVTFEKFARYDEKIKSYISDAVANAGLGGVDTSDATAVAGDILSGKTAYAKGSKVTGTFSLDEEMTTQDELLAQIAEALEIEGSTAPSVGQNNLPPEYQEVEYIESTGTQYINTGKTINTATDTVELVFQNNEPNTYKWFFGEHDNNARFGLGSGDGADKRNVAYGNTTYKVADTLQYFAKHKFIANQSGAFIDETKVANYSSFSSTSTLYLFNLNLSGGNYVASSKIWGYKHTRNGAEILNLVPCYRKSDKAVGMYDLVSNEFFSNNGSGEFLYKNLPLKNNRELQYIESTGTQWIATDVIPNTNTKIELYAGGIDANTFSITGSSGGWFIGSRTAYQDRAFGFYYNPSGQSLYGAFGNSQQSTSILTKDFYGKDHLFVLDKSGLYLDGEKKVSFNTSFTGQYPLSLFTINLAGSQANLLCFKLYYLKVWENDTLVRDFIPVLNEREVPCLYDKVSGNFFYNQGTGEFAYVSVPSYNADLQRNNTELQEILDTINALPEPEEITLQEKTVTPTKSQQQVTADAGFTGLSSVKVEAIPNEYIVPSGTLNIKSNGSYDVTANASVSVNVPIPDGYIVPSGTMNITSNGSYDVTEKAGVVVAVDAPTPVLQNKTVTPTTSKQTINADSGYDGLDTVTVNAMPTATQATPNIEVSSSGLITASATQSAGYVASGTKSATKQLTTKGATTITPSTSSQTAVASGVYTTGAITVAPIPSTHITTEDATAVAENILSGKTAYVKGSKVTGTMPNIGYSGNKPTITYDSSTNTLTPKVVVQKGYHLANTYTGTAISPSGLDSNLKAENIKKGVSIFGVAGTHEGGGSDTYSAIPTQYTIDRLDTDVTYGGTTCAQIQFLSDPDIILPSNASQENTAFYWEHSTLGMNSQVKAIVAPSSGWANAKLSDFIFYVDDSGGYVTYGLSLPLGGSITVTPSTDLPDHCGWRELAVYVDGREISMRNYPSRSGSSIVVGDGSSGGGGASFDTCTVKIVDNLGYGSVEYMVTQIWDGQTLTTQTETTLVSRGGTVTINNVVCGSVVVVIEASGMGDVTASNATLSTLYGTADACKITASSGGTATIIVT